MLYSRRYPKKKEEADEVEAPVETETESEEIETDDYQSDDPADGSEVTDQAKPKGKRGRKPKKEK